MLVRAGSVDGDKSIAGTAATRGDVSTAVATAILDNVATAHLARGMTISATNNLVFRIFGSAPNELTPIVA